jgi:hypothetical protein
MVPWLFSHDLGCCLLEGRSVKFGMPNSINY